MSLDVTKELRSVTILNHWASSELRISHRKPVDFHHPQTLSCVKPRKVHMSTCVTKWLRSVISSNTETSHHLWDLLLTAEILCPFIVSIHAYSPTTHYLICKMTHLIKQAAQAIKCLRGQPGKGLDPEPELLPVNERCEEETLEDYRADRFYPAKYHERLGDYEILVKFGYGGYSTVWLAKDLRTNGFVTIKILTNDYNDDTEFSRERKMLQDITATDPGHPGYQMVRTLLDSIEISGPDGRHTCLVHEPLGLDMLKFHNKYLGIVQFPPYLIKSVTRRMLLALDYLHTACHVVHTGKS